MRYPRLTVAWALAGLFCLPAPSADAAIMQLGDDPGFSTVINFDSLVNETDVLDQFVSVGVRFRDELSLFSSPLGGSPGEIEDGAAFSPPNFLEGEDSYIFALFQTPATQAGAYVASVSDTIFLSAFDSNLQLLGTVSIAAPGNGNWVFLGLVSDMGPIATVRFSSSTSSNGDEFGIDDLGLSPVPIPSSMLLFLSALTGLGFLRWGRRDQA